MTDARDAIRVPAACGPLDERALRAAQSVGRLALLAGEARIRETGAKWETLVAKREHDFATDLDVTVERTMREVLASDRSFSAVVVGEELGGDVDLRRETAWVIDPIDGTTNLVRGIPTFTISLALVVDGRAALGFVSAPLLGERYTAVAGRGAFLEIGDHREPLRVSDQSDIGGALVGLNDIAGLPDSGSRARAGEIAGVIAGRVLQLRCHGSIALDLAWVAAGRLEASVAFSNRPWDVQAGALLVREAGGLVRDADGSDHGLDAHMTVASSAHLVGALLGMLGSPGSG